ncbi:MAG TPA: hypothetical protein VLX92_29300 [Kofleriaceae bacterium]|nr:hypothetical protein [Kofleriaceae bacterium]
MAPDDDEPPRDPTVKDLLTGTPLDDVVDAATRAELERWFGLPSFTELDEQGAAPPPPPDEELEQLLARRAAATAAVDHALLEAIYARIDLDPVRFIKFTPQIDVRVRDDVALLDIAMIDRAASIADPREVEISDELKEDLKDLTPQALLRDLHRPELDFEKQFEIVDVAVERRFNLAEEVTAVMRGRWTLPPAERSAMAVSSDVLAETRALRRRKWVEVFAELPLPNRRVRE